MSMTPEERIFLRDFFRQVSDQPLDPRDGRYIPLYDDPEMAGDDPVELLARAIEWTEGESVQLLSGFRGTGKSTELRRLQQRLQENGYLVLRCDIEDYLNLSLPVDVSDFLMAIAGAFSDAVARSGVIADQSLPEGYWDRLARFMTRVEFKGLTTKLGIGVASAGIQVNLKNDPSFKQRLQEHMAGHLGALVTDVHDFISTSIDGIKKQRGNDYELVLLVDSIEHFRGTLINSEEVQSSVEKLFVSHSEKLRLPYLHVVYTAPPYLKVRYSNLGALYEPGGIHVLPALELRDRDGTRFQKGYDAMERVVQARGDWRTLLGERSALDRLIRYSGGRMRDLFRLLAEVMRRARSLPASESAADAAIAQLRAEFLPVADDDARWLVDVAKRHEIVFESRADLPDLSRFFSTYLAFGYHDGDKWYDLHPLISDHVTRQAEDAHRRHRWAKPAS